MNWSHGYHVSSGYTFGFYRELAPDWLNFAALMNGCHPPDARGAFRYLELGCGQGFGLCLLAASYPKAEFIGVDFNPEHIAHARELARAAELANVRFDEADFSELAQCWPADYGRFEYVVLHGIYSWVPVAIRQALVRSLNASTAPGALVYVSHNTPPGWISAVPLQHILRRLQRQSEKPAPQIIRQGIDLFEALLAAKDGIGDPQPDLKARLDNMKTQNISYLTQEYLHESWHPLWFSEVAEELAGAKLSHVATATLPENYLPGMLPRELADIVRAGEGHSMQQDLIDLVLNQSFRRDIYCRGPRSLRTSMDLLGQCTVHAGRMLTKDASQLETGFYQVELLSKPVIEAITESLAEGPKRISELAALPALNNPPQHEPIQAAALLLHTAHLKLGYAHGEAPGVAAFNRAVAKRANAEFAPYGFLASRHTPNAVPANDSEMLLYGLLAAAPNETDPVGLGTRLLEQMRALGRKLLKDGEPISEPDQEREQAQVMAGEFVAKVLPYWRRFGVL